MALATARLSFFLACLLLRDHTVLLAHGSRLQLLAARRGGQRGGRRGAKHTAAQLVSEIQNAELSAFTSTAPDLSAEDFLASCNFSTADLPGELVKWHNAASACSILGKLDWLVLVGDSLTRQVQPVCSTDILLPVVVHAAQCGQHPRQRWTGAGRGLNDAASVAACSAPHLLPQDVPRLQPSCLPYPQLLAACKARQTFAELNSSCCHASPACFQIAPKPNCGQPDAPANTCWAHRGCFLVCVSYPDYAWVAGGVAVLVPEGLQHAPASWVAPQITETSGIRGCSHATVPPLPLKRARCAEVRVWWRRSSLRRCCSC